jgi:hypothetical protein
VEELLGQFDNVAAPNAGPEENRQNLGIRQRFDAALEKLFARFLLLR